MRVYGRLIFIFVRVDNKREISVTDTITRCIYVIGGTITTTYFALNFVKNDMYLLIIFNLRYCQILFAMSISPAKNYKSLVNVTTNPHKK